MSTIVIRNLAKSWGTFKAVDDISFETDGVEFVALLGPSGCGKSTTLRLIAGLEEVTAGTITIDGSDVTNVPSSKRNLSMVFQSYALFPHLTVGENITFGLSVRGVAKPDIEKRLDRVAGVLGLEQLLARRPSQLSGGQQQRVALGRALISETPVCLLDEPLSNLDAKLRGEMRNEIRSLQQRLGITMLFVTHDQSEAMSMADRVILMNGGRIEQNGTPQDLYDNPRTEFVASFIGTPAMNLIDLEDAPGGAAIAGAPDAVVQTGGGKGLRLGVRPEHIVAGDKGHKAQIVGAEYFGADSIVTCRIGTQDLLIRMAGHVAMTKGDELRLSWPESAAFFFDTATGERRAPAVVTA